MYKGKYSYNESFLDSWSPEMAWFLGVVAADGSITNGPGSLRWLAVSLKSTDRELAEKLRDAISFTGPLHENKTCVVLQIASKDLVEQFAKYGIYPRKSLTIEYPDMPPEFDRHFIRGVFDGDGYVCTSKGAVMSNISAGITSGSEMFARSIADKLTVNGMTVNFNVRNRTGGWQKHTTYEPRVGGHNLGLLFDFLYKDVPPSLYLSRKHDRMVEIIEPCREIYANGKAQVGHGSLKYQRNKANYKHSYKGGPEFCQESGCDRKNHARGLCSIHYSKKWHQEHPEPPGTSHKKRVHEPPENT